MKPLLKIFLVSSLIILSGAKREISFFRVKPVEYKQEGRDLHFPLFYSDHVNVLTAEKINQYLQLSELELLNGFQTNTVFEKVKADNGFIYGAKWEMTYDIYTNNARILSVGFTESSSGMTTAYWDRYYTFNSGNGDAIQLSDLFTSKGYRQFHQYIIKKSVAECRKQLAGIDTAKSNMSDWDEIISEQGKSNISDFYIDGTSIILDGDNLLNKSQKGEIDINVKFKLAEFKGYLNDYGRCVFGLKEGDIAVYHSSSLPQLFTGKIDKYPVLFIIRNIAANEYEGIYCYQKFGKGIYMTGTIANGEIKLEEKTDQFESRAFIRGKITRDSINGTWTKAGKNQPLRLLVVRK
jgi:hypothetical protein